MNATGAPFPLPPFRRYFTPRKSPDPSSPTVAANRIGRAVRTRAATTASATATSAAMPRALSEIPGPSSRRPRRSTETSTSGPNTVSRCAERTTGAGAVAPSPFPLPPSLSAHPETFPASSILTSRSPASRNSSATLAARCASAPVGAGIAESAAWRASVTSSVRSMCWRAALTRSWPSRPEITSCMAIRVGVARHNSQGVSCRRVPYGLWLYGLWLSLDLAQPPRDTRAMDERELIYDWNRAGPAFDWSQARVDLNDETLRDGLQSPSVRDPSLEVKKRLLHLMADLGIVAADIGLPGAGPRVVEQVRVLAREIRDHKLPIFPNCAARTVIADIEPVVRVAEEVGIPIEAATFIGSSPIRQYAEDWTLDRILKATEEAVTYAVKHGLPVMYVTEDTTRARPETLKALYGAAIDCGATRICLADTVGHATPEGVKALVQFVKREIVKQKDVKIDWHGHRDRGMGLVNCLAAIEAGVDRVHATALGVGERVGNAEMDLLIVNLSLLGAHTRDLSQLPEYCRVVAEAVGMPIPANYPVLGTDAFRTGTGVHAAAIIKAKKKGHDWLANRVYSSVPAEEFGLAQKIEISPVSGLSNVKYWLETHGYDAEAEAACRILFEAAKRTDRVLSDEECHRLLKQVAWR